MLLRTSLPLLIALVGLPSWAQTVDFAADIQPIFERSCYGCHRTDRPLGGLALDARAAVLDGVVKPGDADESELFRRVAGLGESVRMPMGGELPAEEIDSIRLWIEQGADWPETTSKAAPREKHWAFVSPTRAELPEVKNDEWVRNPIDRFVLARLEKEGLSPSAEADAGTLFRRMHLDVVGLPPTVDDLEEFAGKRRVRERDYEQATNELLASPHYGERWGRLWLDAARYADSDGFEKDKPREVWFYRDWVVNALNSDMGYDQFIVEQIAGDLLEAPTQDQRVATGFLRNSMINEEGGTDPEQFRMEAMFDRVDAIGKSILGLTIQCAQCHDHKFDPLTQREYYQILAYLNNSHESNVVVFTPEQEQQREQTLDAIRAAERDLQASTPDVDERMRDWEAASRADVSDWAVIRPTVRDMSTGGQRYLPLDDGSFLAQGYAPTKHRVQMNWETEEQGITAMQIELLMHPDLPRGGPGRSIYGTGALSEFEVEIAPASDPEAREKVKIVEATADFETEEAELTAPYIDKSGKRRVTGPVAFAIDGEEDTAWGMDAGPGRRNQPRKAVFRFEEPIGHEGGSVISIYLNQRHGGWNSDDNQNNNLGRMRLSYTKDADAHADPLPKDVREIVSIPAAERSDEQRRKIFSYRRTTVAEWADENAEIDKLWGDFPEATTQLVLNERDDPRMTHMLDRGDFLKPGDEAPPGVPSFLHVAPEGPGNRLTFARWLVDEKAPTTARVIVNRIWQAYFGKGLIETPEDLGSQGQRPSHPELLDWLSVELMENDWSLKHVHRLILDSATYRQASGASEELLSKDPYNTLLARGARFRVDAEIVRDIALQASGLLNPKLGGPPVYPAAPEFLFQPPVSYGPKVWDYDTGENRYRRAIYTFRYRSLPYPALDVFDAPKGDAACIRRSRSNTPLQALTTLNEPMFLEAARALAFEAMANGGAAVDERIGYAFLRCVSREPSQTETDTLVEFLHKQEARYETGELDPFEMLATNPGFRNHLPAGSSPAEAAAWTALSRVLLNLDETLTRE